MQTELRRPPCLILLPNRELSKQVLVCAIFLRLFLSRRSSAFCAPYLTHSSVRDGMQSVVKSLSGHVKLRSAGITSGVKLKIQKESLASPVDILVSTPGRFLQHFEDGTISSLSLFLGLAAPAIVSALLTAFSVQSEYSSLSCATSLSMRAIRCSTKRSRKTLYAAVYPSFFALQSLTTHTHNTHTQQEKMLGIVRKRIEKKGDRPPQTIVVTATVTADLSDAINTHFPVCPTTPFRNSGPGGPFW
jgi:hypothetical protein